MEPSNVEKMMLGILAAWVMVFAFFVFFMAHGINKFETNAKKVFFRIEPKIGCR